MISRDRWTRWALAAICPLAMAVLAGASCVGQEPTGLCTAGADPGETGRLLCPDPGDPSGLPLCVDPSNDSRNCGACGTACASFQLCWEGTCGYPNSCADAQANFGGSVDGSYVIQPIGKKPFTVYCAGMSTATPKVLPVARLHVREQAHHGELLRLLLPQLHGQRLHVLREGEDRPGDAPRHHHRYDPSPPSPPRTQAAGTSTIGGTCGLARDLLPFATAGNCILNGVATPGNVDFRGTTFSIDPSVLMLLNGDSPYGTNSFNSDHTTLFLNAGGDCGGYAPPTASFA